MGNTKSGGGNGGGAKHSPKAPHVDFKGPRTRARSKVSDAEFQKAKEIGDKQPTVNMRGGVGIPGPRKIDAVNRLTPLDFANLPAELPAILAKSQAVRGNKDIKAVRNAVKTVNRKVVYRPGARDVHSLHVGNDIAAVFNSKRSKVYDYPELAPKLDQRLRANNGAKGKTYFDESVSVADRHSNVGEGMKHVISGNNEEAQKSFDNAGLTEKGRKWVHKMSTLMLAERGRELNGRNKDLASSQVSSALDHVKAGTSYEDVFVKRADELAPFAKRGGAKTLK